MGGLIGVLLAAGRSVRMGREKTALKLSGETLIERHIRQLRLVGVNNTNLMAVTNPDNQSAIIHETGIATVLQQGQGMSRAVLTGLQSFGRVDCVWVVCVNDVILDSDYRRLNSCFGSIVIPTYKLESSFEGGMLSFRPDSVFVESIVEKPPGGCPPGSHVNIMVHRISGSGVIESLKRELSGGLDYESAINHLIMSGVAAKAVPVDFWVGIKTPQDYLRATTFLNHEG